MSDDNRFRYEVPGKPGHFREWDGARWIDIRPARKRRLAGVLGIVGLAAIGGLLLLAVGIFVGTQAGIVANSEPEKDTAEVPVATSAPAQSAPEEREPVKSAEQRMDDTMRVQGFEIVESGTLYIRAASEGEFSCGYAPCLAYVVYTVDGCPNALYVEASIVDGEVVVGMANDLLSAVPAQGTAAVMLEDYERVGNAFRLTEVTCY